MPESNFRREKFLKHRRIFVESMDPMIHPVWGDSHLETSQRVFWTENTRFVSLKTGGEHCTMLFAWWWRNVHRGHCLLMQSEQRLLMQAVAKFRKILWYNYIQWGCWISGGWDSIPPSPSLVKWFTMAGGYAVARAAEQLHVRCQCRDARVSKRRAWPRVSGRVYAWVKYYCNIWRFPKSLGYIPYIPPVIIHL